MIKIYKNCTCTLGACMVLVMGMQNEQYAISVDNQHMLVQFQVSYACCKLQTAVGAGVNTNRMF